MGTLLTTKIITIILSFNLRVEGILTTTTLHKIILILFQSAL